MNGLVRGVRGARYALVLGVLLVVALLLGLMKVDPGGATLPLVSDWQYRWADATTLTPLDDPWDAPGWTAHAMPAHPERSAEPVLFLRTRLPSARYRDPAIAIDAVIGPFEAYLGTKRIHAHPRGGIASTELPGVPWQLITVPQDASASVFVLRVRGNGQSALVRGTPLYGERADHIAWVLRRDVVRLACGLVVILVGLVGLGVFAGRGYWRLPVGFATWTVALGLYVVHYTHAKDLLVDAPRAWFVIWLVLLPAMPVGGLLFVDTLFGTGRRGVLARLLRLHAVYLPAMLAIDAICAVLYPTAPKLAAIVFAVPVYTLRALIVAGVLAAFVVVGRRARQGDEEAKIFLAGLFILFALSSTDVLASFGVASLSWKSLTHWGVLALTLAQALILQRRFGTALAVAASSAAEVRLREREKESLLRDLHDGVGGLTSNIRLLAELGQRSDDRARRSLSTIVELSDKTLSQLRAFVQALDDTTTSWDTLAAELRRFGAQLVAATGGRFEMTTEIEAKGSPPGLLSIHVLRVFQESLTNSLKQRAASIRVSLRVDAYGLELMVISEGASEGEGGGPSVGLDLGRGLGNMKARAAELGGTFAIEHGRDPPTKVRLVVPLPLRLPMKPPGVVPEPAIASTEES